MLRHNFIKALSIDNFKRYQNLFNRTWTDESEKKPINRSKKRFKKLNPKSNLKDLRKT